MQSLSGNLSAEHTNPEIGDISRYIVNLVLLLAC
jgi:hypothetical protein